MRRTHDTPHMHIPYICVYVIRAKIQSWTLEQCSVKWSNEIAIYFKHSMHSRDDFSRAHDICERLSSELSCIVGKLSERKRYFINSGNTRALGEEFRVAP